MKPSVQVFQIDTAVAALLDNAPFGALPRVGTTEGTYGCMPLDVAGVLLGGHAASVQMTPGVLPERLAAALADRYSIERQLGQGGMATVYLARDLKHHRNVAIKVLKPELAAALGSERFLREIEIAAQLTHPHILPLYDSGQADGFLYYTMPFVEGESLRDRLTREPQLPLDEALQITREVADALGYAHALGLVHRDIKPENILFEAGHAVVADFGIARAVSAASSERLTATGLSVGTPAYMSPEQAVGSREVDGRSDLYSLGCVLYEMLSGEPPYSGPTAQAILAKKLAEPLPRISVVREVVPAGIEAALTKALARTPADRWTTAAAFAAELSHPDETASSRDGQVLSLRRSRTWRLATAAAVLVAIGAGGSVGFSLWRRASRSHYPRTAIAVLPLENLSVQGPDAYFASGLHDELLTQLGKVGSLKVIGRTSVGGYEGTSKQLNEIADELAVGSIVEGSVQVVGNRLRVIVQLIDPVTEAHLWAERYDRTLDDAFAVQSDIAQHIATAVGTTLSGTEAGAITKVPTQSGEAYRLYLQGLEFFRRPGYLRENFRAAQQRLERALVLDSSFALAHAALSNVHGGLYWFRYDPSPARAEAQRREAEAALRLQPDLPQAHAAMGNAYYRGRRDFGRALEEFNLALRSSPNDADLWQAIAAVQRRLGNWDSVDLAVARSAALDPRNANLFVDLGAGTHLATRRYSEAIQMTERGRRITPDLPFVGYQKALIYLLWKGDLDTFRVLLRGLPPNAELGGGAGTANEQRAELLLWERQPDSLLMLLRGLPVAFDQQESFRPRALYAAWAQLLRGDSAAARTAFDSAATLLDSVVRVLPDDWRVHSARGQVLAGLGRHAEALREARWLAQSEVYRKDHSEGPFLADERAQILARIGEKDAALREIGRILAGPSWTTSVHTLRIDPRWDPIRADPRFEALLSNAP